MSAAEETLVSLPKTKLKYRFALIPVGEVTRVWRDVRDMLAPAVERSHGRWTMEYLCAALCTGNQQLWVAYDDDGVYHGALCSQLVTYPNNRMLAIQFLGGDKFFDWGADLLALLERYAADSGCDGVEAVARMGFTPFFKECGYDRSYAMYELSL